MRKFITIFSAVAGLMIMSSIPAFAAGSGPYGGFGPMFDNHSISAVDTEHVVMFGGTGPYGTFGSVEGYNIISGAEKTRLTSSWGDGPYGVFNGNGLVARDKASKHECLLVAMNCPIR
jgi:hypothetical protein